MRTCGARLTPGVTGGVIEAVFGIAKRTTFYRETRARAYDFPLEEIENRNGGRPPADDDDEAGEAAQSDAEGDVGAAQQQLDAVADGGSDRDASNADGAAGAGGGGGEPE